ncbi:MAG: PQQ-dependent dehydrogenase, methanol/ethanol family [Deltaproteobacteria bacterium]|nr:PQQ-dependent dehydrogenase, methanol/ethanol family [Deltaproteobacteria bacterium]MBW2361753.1 PQQ-dependent dehydrogenase, methanol/ethanol family [Deltaproteobacteria bacterium]
MRNRTLKLALSACSLLLFACSQAPSGDPTPAADARLLGAASEPGSWLTHGGSYAEQRFSTLSSIDEGNVAELGLAWSFDLQTERGVEATPLVADGVMYVSAPFSIVHALDAATGELRWTYDPNSDRSWSRNVCCGFVNRGVALYGDKIYVGTLDGRLVAVERASGSLVWEVSTVEGDRPYSITGAPRVVEGKVIIGNAGADFGVRGYVSAYDAETGELAWRTYTVPGNPADGFESPAMERAAETWTGEWWVAGGGGTAWDGMAYDPELRLLYVGTGNGAPSVRWLRSPDGGDNLYLASILALDPATGEIVWHYQENPAESWDYTATQPLLLADLEIDGRQRKVILHAPKNGFFFVIDRSDGSFISAEPFTTVTWALRYDENGRPVENPEADYRDEPKFIRPSPYGGHSWPPMSFHPGTGLVYFPKRDMGSIFASDPDWEYRPKTWNTGLDTAAFSEFSFSDGGPMSAALVAWDPVAQREVWSVDHVTGFNGGTLSTAGGLVFQGSSDGRFVAYRATDGEKLWESPTGTGVMAGPVTYTVAGEQYVAVAAGWGASFAMNGGQLALAAGVRGGGRVLTFKLGGRAQVPPGKAPLGPVPEPTYALESTEEEREQGMALYHFYCSVCHGPQAVAGGSVPDLRHLTEENHALFDAIVRGGLRQVQGMPAFADLLSTADIHAIQAWILGRARESVGGV